MRTIMAKGGYIRKEGEASGTITPGMLVEFGGSNDLQAHSTAAGIGRKAFAVENDLIGRGIDDDYSAGEVVQYIIPEPGGEVYALLAGGETVSKGDALVSAGDGTLAAMGSGEEAGLIGFAMEDLANSASLPARLIVEAA